jgi:hypothetical protein
MNSATSFYAIPLSTGGRKDAHRVAIDPSQKESVKHASRWAFSWAVLWALRAWRKARRPRSRSLVGPHQSRVTP